MSIYVAGEDVGAIELMDAADLDRFVGRGGNVVVNFYKPGCPYCQRLEPVYDRLARLLHRRNDRAAMTRGGPAPISFARIDGHAHLAGINALRPGFLGEPPHRRLFPTILFRRGHDGLATTWDPSVPREEARMLSFMADFFEDPWLRSLA